MPTVTVTELKAKLSEKLRDVQRGEELLVTDHGNVVARIVPARDVEAERLALAKEGKLRLGTGKLPAGLLASLRDASTRTSSAQPKADLLEALLEERREAR